MRGEAGSYGKGAQAAIRSKTIPLFRSSNLHEVGGETRRRAAARFFPLARQSATARTVAPEAFR